MLAFATHHSDHSVLSVVSLESDLPEASLCPMQVSSPAWPFFGRIRLHQSSQQSVKVSFCLKGQSLSIPLINGVALGRSWGQIVPKAPRYGQLKCYHFFIICQPISLDIHISVFYYIQCGGKW